MAGGVVVRLMELCDNASVFWQGAFLVAVLAFSAGMAAVLFIEAHVRAQRRRPVFHR